LQISTANVVTSLLFVGLHLFMNPPFAALLVLIPSLVYGYFRDHSDSIVPSIVLHCAYNAFVVVGLVIAGNVIWSSAS
jgi:membrane protease YdiL (CAAX protease family)